MKKLTPTLSDRLERQITLIGLESTEKLVNSSVCIIGLGGVGGYVCEMLARAGVGKLYLVDCDTVSVSNLNRQIIALMSTVGMKKTDAMRQRILEINPECDVLALDVFVTKDNADEIIEKCECDIVIDCIDNVSAKVGIIKSAKARDKYVFSAMGAGNKLNLSDYTVTDISKTHTCGLARAIRKQLRDEGIEHLDVLFSKEAPAKIGERSPASICYMPSGAGLIIAEYIIKRITQ
jgi:tRNA A37 threonylcarbamoyladenosine dehydratase